MRVSIEDGLSRIETLTLYPGLFTFPSKASSRQRMLFRKLTLNSNNKTL